MKKIILFITIILSLQNFLIANDCDYIMDNDRMEIIIDQMNNKSDDTKKLNTIKTYLQRLCIDTNQMLSIMKVFESREVQNQFLLYAKEYIIDIENYNKLKTN
mgnify:CR=1 FL=1